MAMGKTTPASNRHRHFESHRYIRPFSRAQGAAYFGSRKPTGLNWVFEYGCNMDLTTTKRKNATSAILEWQRLACSVHYSTDTESKYRNNVCEFFETREGPGSANDNLNLLYYIRINNPVRIFVTACPAYDIINPMKQRINPQYPGRLGLGDILCSLGIPAVQSNLSNDGAYTVDISDSANEYAFS